MSRLTSFDILNLIDKFPIKNTHPEEYGKSCSGLYHLLAQDHEGPYVIGYMAQPVVKAFEELPTELGKGIHVDHVKKTILAFTSKTREERTAQVAAVMNYWRENQTFPLLKGWRNELWPVYARNGVQILYDAERASIGLLGVNGYGVHMNAFVRDANGDMRLWIGRRAATKSTWPGMLDNTVAGGLMTGEDKFECIVREADEEANLPEAIIRKNATFHGSVVYISTKEIGKPCKGTLIYPECQWIYDVELPPDVVPMPKDGEVETFYLWTVEETLEKLYNGEFKPNCGLVLVDFLMRHGIITKDNDVHYELVKSRLRRPLPFPGPHTLHVQ
ncbi:hypothetical protein TD95_003024 [Thielaviopsis punctulata]|uniref:Nudix hydrolase domain-containing protein n=1 Tax=Thielaviopsis punctulata TaxID=72032 RepID=A0A0F4ZCM3_9PEZI|nr:hypothetical protein TD95_003024 [Thielaviopsis punctulata]